MGIDIKKDFYSKLSTDKIKIRWNKNPIKMELLKSFLTIPITCTRVSSTWWTNWENKEKKLYITGGIVGGIEYLDRIEYGYRLDNIYNNYVNPFYLFDIMTEKGKRFFLDYYKDDIDKFISDQKKEIERMKKLIEHKRNILEAINNEPIVFIEITP